jgi:hypothetical protein
MVRLFHTAVGSSLLLIYLYVVTHLGSLLPDLTACCHQCRPVHALSIADEEWFSKSMSW